MLSPTVAAVLDDKLSSLSQVFPKNLEATYGTGNRLFSAMKLP